jgi:hypothetical protein
MKARRKSLQPIGKQSLNIRDTPPSDLGSDTNYPEGFHGVFQSFQANAVILSQNGLWSPVLRPAQCFLLILRFHAV